jgi:PAS domain S-box-containing protein
MVKDQLARRRKGISDVYELNFKSREGTCLIGMISAAPLMVNDTFLGSVGIVTDITHMKQVQSELRSARDFSEKIVNNITDNLIVVDPGTHRIAQANTSFLARVGLDAEKVLGEPCYAVMLGRKTPCWEDGIHCPVRESAAIKRPAKCDKVYLNAEGQERMLQVLTYPLFNSSGDVELVIRMEHDVTEKRRMEEALAFRSKELQKTQHQLETLFEISRRASAEDSLQELIHSLHDFA